MGRIERIEIMKDIENMNASKLICYITSDRQGGINARIGQDAVRPLYNHLLSLEEIPVKRIDLFVYSRGGDVSVPWRIISMIREFCQELYVLVPYKAHSAATMIALGADKIVMGKKAELGPIDPTLERRTTGEATNPPQEISVEDVSSYVSFMKERANLNDQNALATVISLLANHLTPLTLGSVNRQYSHIRLVARKLLTSRIVRMDEDRINAIIEALTEKMYSHGHAIGRKEATELGLPVLIPEQTLEQKMWELYEQYENAFKLTNIFDVETLLGQQEELTINNLTIACIESIKRLDTFTHNLAIRRKRQIPQNPQLNFNLNISLPSNIDLQKIPQESHQILQNITNQISQILPHLIKQELRSQCPEIGIEQKLFGGGWGEKDDITNPY